MEKAEFLHFFIPFFILHTGFFMVDKIGMSQIVWIVFLNVTLWSHVTNAEKFSVRKVLDKLCTVGCKMQSVINNAESKSSC